MDRASASFVSRRWASALAALALIALSLVSAPPALSEGAWEALGPDTGVISALAIAPQNPSTLYASLYRGATYKSTDSGATWQASGPGEGRDIVVAPSGVFMAGNSGVVKSTDGGATWDKVLLDIRTNALALDPSDPRAIYAGTQDGRVLKTVDAGVTWAPTGLLDPTGPIADISVDPANVGRVFASVCSDNWDSPSGGVYKSVDGGSTWTEVLNVPSRSIAVASDGTFYVGTPNGNVWTSVDGGANWTSSTISSTDWASVLTLAVDPIDSSVVFAGGYSGGDEFETPYGLWKSTDGGSSWTRTSIPKGPVGHVVIDPSNPDTIYAGGEVGTPNGFGLFKSTDGGDTWAPATDGMSTPIRGMVATASGRIYVATDTGVFRTETDGTWSYLHGGYGQSVAAAPDDPEVVYFGTWEGGVLKTGDGGASWTQTGLEQFTVQALAVSASDPARVYAGTEVGIFKTTDGAATWAPTSLADVSVSALAVRPDNPDAVFAGGDDGTFRSTDGGANWGQVSNDATYSLAIGPNDANTVYAGGYGRITKSSDGGSSWNTIETWPVEGSPVTQLLFDPGDPSLLYAEAGSVLRTGDGGATWAKAVDPPVFAQSLAVTPGTPSQAYIGTDQGVFGYSGTFEPLTPPSTSLSLESWFDTDEIGVGEQATFTADVRNDGPNTAIDVEMSLWLDQGLSFVSASAPGPCGGPPPWHSDDVAGCSIGDLAPGQIHTVYFVLEGVESGEWYAEATVHATNDPNPDNYNGQYIVVAGPEIAAHPGSAPVGWSVRTEGSRFGAEEPVSVMLDDTEVAAATADADGSFTTSFTVSPSLGLGDHTLSAVGASGSTAETVFTVLETAGPNVYRTAHWADNLGLSADLDPTSEYTYMGFGLLSQALVRSLVTYRHVVGAEGNKVVPDLATDLGQVSEDGMTYTFTLKQGVRFGPPLDRAITSGDVAYAFERLASSQYPGGYAYMFDGVIDGFAVHDGPPAPISGIETPDSQTIVFYLTQPTPDFLLRLAMPAAGPIPSEVAGCFEGFAEYGRYLVSSGPYMIRGADQMDASSCDTLTPTAGWRPGGHLELVRNPSYGPTTDSPEVRENNIDGVQILIGIDRQDVFDLVRDGELDGSLMGDPRPDVVDEYLNDPNLRPLLHDDELDTLHYISMNLLVPPFDDVHVRRAVSLAIDKSAMQEAWGGSLRGSIATQILPSAVLPGAANYDPYPDHNGNIAAAKDEMRLAVGYDTDGDGVCDAPACDGVTMLTYDYGEYPVMASVVASSLAPLGITLDVQMDSNAYGTVGNPANLIALAAFPGWGKDYADPANFAFPLLHSSGIRCGWQSNYSELGMTEEQATDCGVHDQWQAAHPPSLDNEIETCGAAAGAERSTCWEELDRTLMQDVVPWVPYRFDKSLTIVGPQVRHYEFDQFGSMISLVHISLGPQDTTAPSISIAEPPEGASYVLGQTVAADYSCEDEADGSGVASCDGDVPDGDPIDTASIGTKTFTVNATDLAGNHSTLTHSYSVGYKFVGFTSPVDKPPVFNLAKAGQAIPLKWRVLDANNNPVTNLPSVKVTVASLACSLGVTQDQIEEYASGSSGLQNLGGGYYQFNWKTPTSYAKSCKTMTLDLGDGNSSYQALFKFTK